MKEKIIFSNNRSNSNLDISASEIFELNNQSLNYLQAGLDQVKAQHHISFSGIVDKTSGIIDLLPNVPRSKVAHSDTLQSLKQQALDGFVPLEFPKNPQILLEDDLKQIYKDQFNFPCYQPNVNRIPEHIKHLYQVLHPNDFNSTLNVSQAEKFLGFTVNIYKDSQDKLHLLTRLSH